MESPFQTTARVCSEPVLPSDDLRIIANGDGRLTPAQRDILRAAAEDYQTLHRTYVFTDAKLAEEQAHSAALASRLRESDKRLRQLENAVAAAPAKPPSPSWSMGTGWITTQASG